MPSECILALDVGTSSARAGLYDAQARAVPGMAARRPYSMRTTPDGGVEGDAPFLLGLLGEAIDEVLAKAGPARIAAVATSTFWHSLLGVDPEGAPVTSVFTWADMRAEPFVDLLRQRMDEKAYHARTGAFFHPLFHPSKYLWLGPTRAARWMSFGDWAYERLFGRFLTTISMASGTGLLDTHACQYDEETLRRVGLRPEQLAPLGDTKDFFQGLREPYRSRWPALRDVPWMPPVGDGACNNIGSGCSTRDRIGLMIGTSGAMRVAFETDRIEIPWGLWCYRADRRRVVLGGALNDGGNLVEWCRNTLKLGVPEEVERELGAMEPDRHGLTFLPFLAGERSTGWAAHARAAITGLHLASTPVEILRAGMEAVALRFAVIYELMPEAREIVASGGALLKSHTWTQILADAIGRPIVPSAEPESSSRGVALLALEALGRVQRLEEFPAAVGPALEPDRARHMKYVAALARQRDLYDRVIRRGKPGGTGPGSR
ncbi:MAG TPA: gluconokinase [Planctomycetota bacterium]|nr:gluconokinase [Planctomycetota bacterium]